MKRAVINYAAGARYPQGQARLKKSMRIAGGGVEFIGFNNTKDFGSPSHQEIPYAFKTHALMYCLNKGYDQAIFADASIWAVKSWDPIWKIINDQGYYFEEAGHLAGTWTKDSVLSKMGYTRDRAMGIPMFSAGFVGLNFKNLMGVEFLKKWHEYACDGDSFIGTWDNKHGQMSADPRCKGHRHDMSVASILAWMLGMKLGTAGTFLAYRGPGYGEPKQTVVAYLQSC